MARTDSGPVILPFRSNPREGEPDIRVNEVFEVDGVPHQLIVCIWGDAYSAELVNLVSLVSCPLADLSALQVSSPSPALPPASPRR